MSYRIPDSELKEFNLAVQRANRRITSTFKYVQQDIQTDRGKRGVLGDLAYKSTWHSEKVAFSRSKIFESEKAYQDYKKELLRWGSPTEEKFKASAYVEEAKEVRRQEEYKKIIKALTTTAQEHGQGTIFTEEGNLPAEIADQIKDLTYDQMLNWFDVADPSEDIEHSTWNYEDYVRGVDRKKFVELTVGRIQQLKQVF